jgi:hypothetical protein
MRKTEKASSPRLLTTVNMASLIQTSPETLTTWRKKGIVPCIKLQHVIRFDPDRVLEALAKLEKKEAKK